jgi:hypothetical protein
VLGEQGMLAALEPTDWTHTSNEHWLVNVSVRVAAAAVGGVESGRGAAVRSASAAGSVRLASAAGSACLVCLVSPSPSPAGFEQAIVVDPSSSESP